MRAIRRLHLHGAEHVVPVLATSREHGVEIGRAIARDQRARLARPTRLARARTRSRRVSPGCELDAASAAPRRDRARRRRVRTAAPAATQRRGRVERAVAAEELARGRRSRRSAGRPGRRRRRAGRTRCSRDCARTARRSAASISVTMNGADGAARRAQHPFDVGRDRQPARRAPTCCASVRREILTGRRAARTAAARARCRARVCSKRL